MSEDARMAVASGGVSDSGDGDRFDWPRHLSAWRGELAREAGWLAWSRVTPWVAGLGGAGLGALVFAGMVGLSGGVGAGVAVVGLVAGCLMVLVALGVGVIGVARSAWRVGRRPWDWVAAVTDERLNTRSAMSSAMAFEARGVATGFEALASAWGRGVASRLRAAGASVTPGTAGLARDWWRARRRWAGVCLGLVVLGGAAGWAVPAAFDDGGGRAALALNKDGGSDSHSDSTDADPRTPARRDRPRGAATAEAGIEREAAASGVSGDTEPDPGAGDEREVSERHGGSGTSSMAGGSGAEARPTGGSGAGDERPRAESREQAQRRKREGHRRKPDRPEAGGHSAAASASTASAASGAGRMDRSGYEREHDWRMASQAAAEAVASEDTAEVVSDEPEASQRQRLGVQPSLRDRNASPSRQLGISGPKGPPGTGRGGPTPVKRSRGTAAMLVGVPMPELVLSPAQPGAVRTTVEPQAPMRTPGVAGQGATPTASSSMTTGAAWQPIGPERSATRRYLEMLRADNDDRVPPTKPGDPKGTKPLSVEATE